MEKGRKQIGASSSKGTTPNDAPSTSARKKSKVCPSHMSSDGKKGNQNDPFIPPPRAQILNQKWFENEAEMSFEQSELDIYLGEVVEKAKPRDEHFNVLLWWKLHEPRFHVLAAMARDVLAVPISTVASVSVHVGVFWMILGVL